MKASAGKSVWLLIGLLGVVLLCAAWTPTLVKDDPLVRMPGTQPEQGAILQAPGMDFPNGCINCHGEDPTDGSGNIVAPGYSWSGSMMAQAARDPIFWATMTVAAQDSIWKLGNPNAVDLCLRCHMPEGWLGGRSGSDDPTSFQLNGSAFFGSDFDGVHCDLCHRAWDPHFKSLHDGTREGDDWTGYWDEAEHTAPGSQWRADVTLAEDAALALEVTHLSGSSFFQNDMPPAGYNENGGGQFFVSLDNIVQDFQVNAKKRAGFADTVSDHSDLYSRYHKSKFFCATCHDVSNPVLANVGHEAEDPLPSEAQSAYAYGHVERTFSEFMLSAYGRQGGTATNPAFQQQGAPDITWAAKCQDCHMADVTGKGCEETAAPLRPDDSAEHPNSGAPFHNFQGGNLWLTEVFASIDDHVQETYDPVNLALLDQGPEALTLDLTQGISLKDQGGTLAAASDRARDQLTLAATIKNLDYDQATGNLSFRVQNNTGHRLLSGYPEGRRTFVSIRAYDGAENLLYEVNPYAHDLDLDGRGATLKGLSDFPATSPPLGANEAHVDELVYEAKTGSSFTGEDKTFHFVLATHRYKDNRIPPKGYDIARAADRLCRPAWNGSPALGYFSEEEYLGGYDEVTLNGVLPPGAARVEVALYYQGTSREYVQFLREEINGTASSLSDPSPSGELVSYIVQTDPFFASLKEWGDTIWSLWKHNHGLPLESADVPQALSGEVFPIAGGTPVDGIVPLEMASADWPADVTDSVSISSVIYDGVAQTLTVIATSSNQPNVALSAEGYGALDWKSWKGFYRNTFTGVASEPTSVTVISSGGGSDLYVMAPADVVEISSAIYDPIAQTLTVVATSSEQPDVSLAADGLGGLEWKSWKSFYRNTFMGVASRPDSVAVSSSGGGSDTYVFPGPDTVSIDQVAYDEVNQTLTVVATSSSQPDVTLVAQDHGTLDWKSWKNFYRNTFTGVASKPADVTVSSSAGGSDTQPVP